MGRQISDTQQEARQRREFMRCLLDDLSALEFMLDNDLIEADVRAG